MQGNLAKKRGTLSEFGGNDDEVWPYKIIKGILSYANDRFCEMLGYNRDELVGQPADSFIDISNQGLFEDHPIKEMEESIRI